MWDLACGLQGDMFRTVSAVGGLSVQLVYYRGLSECRSSRWVSDTDHLARLMTCIDCRAGETQIGKVLAHAKRVTESPQGLGARKSNPPSSNSSSTSKPPKRSA